MNELSNCIYIHAILLGKQWRWCWSWTLRWGLTDVWGSTDVPYMFSIKCDNIWETDLVWLPYLRKSPQCHSDLNFLLQQVRYHGVSPGNNITSHVKIWSDWGHKRTAAYFFHRKLCAKMPHNSTLDVTTIHRCDSTIRGLRLTEREREISNVDTSVVTIFDKEAERNLRSRPSAPQFLKTQKK